MVDGNGAHPSPDRLVAFAQGRLNEDELVAMSRHLQRCPGCLSAAESMPGDFFVATLRQHAPRTVQPADKGKPAVPASPDPLARVPRQQPAPASAGPSGTKPPVLAGAPAPAGRAASPV